VPETFDSPLEVFVEPLQLQLLWPKVVAQRKLKAPPKLFAALSAQDRALLKQCHRLVNELPSNK
jgi:hypothetical protein